MKRSRELIVQSRYLRLPVKNSAPERRMSFIVNGETVREFDIELASTDGQDFVIESN